MMRITRGVADHDIDAAEPLARFLDKVFEGCLVRYASCVRDSALGAILRVDRRGDLVSRALRLVMMTYAPAAANPSAMARPVPREEPVTIAILPVRSNKFIASLLWARRQCAPAPRQCGDGRDARHNRVGAGARGIPVERSLPNALEDAYQQEEVECEVPVEVGQAVQTDRGAVARNHFLKRREAARSKVDAPEPRAPVRRQNPVHRKIGEIGNGIADRGQFQSSTARIFGVPGA